MDYNNSGFATTFTLPFSLESGMSSSDYIKVVFPFALHTSFTGTAPDDLVAQYSVATTDEYMCGMGDYLTASIALNIVDDVNQEDTSYYISFFDSNEASVALTAGQYYYL